MQVTPQSIANGTNGSNSRGTARSNVRTLSVIVLPLKGSAARLTEAGFTLAIRHGVAKSLGMPFESTR